MKLLYFRVIVGFLFLLAFSVLIPRVVLHRFIRDDRRPPEPVMSRGAHGVQNRLQAADPADLEQEVDVLGRLVDYPLCLADLDDSTLPPQVLRGGLSDSVYHIQSPRGERMEYVSLRNARKFLVMGPFPEPPRPGNTEFLLLVVLTLLMTGLVGAAIVVPVARNLRILENAATQFGEGVLNSRAEVKSKDAVGSVANRFNHMADRIEKMIQRERQLLQSVSHELRTPIARIRFSLDMLSSAANDDERQHRVKEIDTDLAEIDQLVGELLDYNRYQSDSIKLARETFWVHPAIEETDHRLQDFRPEIHIDVVSPDNSDCTVIADRILFRRAMQNLIMNAIKYARSRVTVEFRRDPDATIVQISDDGPGIPADQRDLVTKPFYRVESGDGRGSGGVGLGLAIVTRIIELHKGKITLGESPSGGASVTTVWPDHP